ARIYGDHVGDRAFRRACRNDQTGGSAHLDRFAATDSRRMAENLRKELTDGEIRPGSRTGGDLKSNPLRDIETLCGDARANDRKQAKQESSTCRETLYVFRSLRSHDQPYSTSNRARIGRQCRSGGFKASVSFKSLKRLL